ncbi:MAG: hypothetical protein ACI4PW_04895 [Alphaproteobacteria bacterium]
MKTMPYNFSYGTRTSLPGNLSTAINYNKGLQALYDNTSLALSTGKYINSSHDNSTLYFKDMRLTERASGLTSVLDSVSTITTTLSSVDEAVTSLTDLVKQAKASATYAAESINKTAKMVSEYTFKDDQILTDTGSLKDGDTILFRTGDARQMEASVPVEKKMKLSDLGIAAGDSFNIKVGDADWVSMTVADEDMRLDAFLGQVTTLVGEDKLQYEIKDGKLTFTSPDRSPILVGDQHYLPGTNEIDETNTDPNVASKLGLDLGHSITIRDGQTVEEFANEISAIDGIDAFVNTRGKLQISSVYGDDLVIGDLQGKAAEFMGVQGGAEDGVNARQKYAEQYNTLLKQINDLVKDSRFDGLNLLEGDNIRVVFNEEGTSVRTIQGIRLDTESLGLEEAAGDWQDPADISDSLSRLESALTKVRSAANKFQQDMQMVQSRETFLTGLGETFKNGAEVLTKADLDEVSALLIAIETQQELAMQVTSITLDSNASILSMF